MSFDLLLTLGVLVAVFGALMTDTHSADGVFVAGLMSSSVAPALTGVRRGGERLEPPFTDVRVRPGDVLLLDTRPGFRGTHEESEEFFVTSEAGGETDKTEAEARESIDWNVLGSC